MFVRVKKIKGGEYAYLVENSWQKGSSRQKVVKYLGNVLRPSRAKSEGLKQFLKLDDIGEYVKNNEFKNIIINLLLLEIKNHDSKTGLRINFENWELKNNKDKGTVLGINDGFMTTETLKELMSYDCKEDYSGFRLAYLITAAGIRIEQEVFVKLFEKLREEDKETLKKIDFYY